MNDRDFDKLLGDRLREEKRFNEDDSEWQRLTARLDSVAAGDAAVATSGSNKFRRWILPLVALLLLAISGLFFNKLTDLDKKNAALMAQVKILKPQLTTIHDTVYIKQTDTIFIERNTAQGRLKNTYSTVKAIGFIGSDKGSDKGFRQIKTASNDNAHAIKNGNLEGNSHSINDPHLSNNANAINKVNLTSEPNVLDNEKQLKALKDRILDLENKLQASGNQRLTVDTRLKNLEEKEKERLQKATSNQEELTDKKASEKDLKATPTSKSDSLAGKITHKAVDSVATNSTIDPLSKNVKNTIKTNKRPTTARLFAGLSGGLLYYKSTWKNAQAIDFYRNEKSYQVGLKLEYALTDRIRLTAGGDYCPFNFEIFWQDSRYNLPAPAHFYPANEKIKSSKAQQKLAQLTIGSKYLFADGTNRWRPYVGAGYTAMRILPFDTEYTIQNIANPALIRTHIEASNGVNIANLLLMTGGLEYRFSRRFVVQGEAFYNLELNRPQKTYDLFGVRGAFLVNF